MKKFLLIPFYLILSLFLVSCGTMGQPQEQLVIYKTKLQPIPIPNHLLVSCPIPLPPNNRTYAYLNPQEKEEALTNYTIELHKSITQCNNTIDAGRKWNEQQMKLFKQPE